MIVPIYRNFHIHTFCDVNKQVLFEGRFKEAATEVFYKKAVLKNLTMFTGKPLCWSLFLIKLQAKRPATLFKRDCNTEVFQNIYFEEHL